MARSLAAILATMLCFGTTALAAEPTPKPPDENINKGAEDPEEDRAFVLSLKGLGRAAFHPESTQVEFGGGLSFEGIVADGRLAAQIGVRVLILEEGMALPIEIMGKLLFPVDDLLEPYVGFGPSLIIFTEGQTDQVPDQDWTMAANAVAGLNMWFGKHFGLALQLAWSLYWLGQRPVNTAGGSLRVNIGF